MKTKSMELYFSPQSILFSSLIPLLILLCCYYYYYQNKSRKPTPPSSAILKPYPLLGTLPYFIKNRHRFLEWTAEILIQSPIHTITIKSPISANGIITADPRNVEHMLKTNFPNFPRSQISLTVLQDFLGHGIFNSDGDHWKQQRKTASYEFNNRSLRNFVMDTVHHEITERLFPLLTKTMSDEEVIELQDVLERFGFDVVCKVVFGEDPACLTEQGKGSKFMKAFADAQNLTVGRFMDTLPFTWRIKRLLNIGTERKLKRSIEIVQDFAEKIIKSKKRDRLKELKEGKDLLSRLALKEDSTEELLRDNVISFILAGRETTSSALTWFFWILSSHPDVEKRILEEVKSIRDTNQNLDEMFSFDELREMNYLHAAITESLRLYPPVAIDTQSCRDGDIMPDRTFVGKNWSVTYSAYAMGRMEDIWGNDCMEYKPERWLDNGVFQPESPFKFPVFHAGPRMCLGKEMAYIQMKSIVASVLERFKIQVMEEGKNPEPLLSLTMRMKGGLPIRVRERVCVDG